jgi:hypothetical protein
LFRQALDCHSAGDPGEQAFARKFCTGWFNIYAGIPSYDCLVGGDLVISAG